MELLQRLRDRIGWLHVMRRMQLPVLTRLLRLGPKVRVLDVGCSDGQMAIGLARKVALMVACEPSPRVARVPRRPRLVAVRAAGEALPFKAGAFDRVVLSSVIQMVPDGVALLREARRVLAADGLVVLSCPVSYRFIGRLFTTTKTGRRLRQLWRLPTTLRSFEDELRCRFGTLGPGFIPLEQLQATLKDAGFTLVSWEYSPRGLGTFFYEVLLLAKYRLGGSLSVAGPAPMLLYPLVWLDRFLPAHSVGCEVSVAGRPVPA